MNGYISTRNTHFSVCLVALVCCTASLVRGAGQVDLVTPARLSRPLTLHILGPETAETAAKNPFRDYRVDVTFRQDELSSTVPAYYAAGADAANSGVDSGRLWKAHFIPDRSGEWSYEVKFRTGTDIALSTDKGISLPPDGTQGKFHVESAGGVLDSWSRGKLRRSARGYMRFTRSGDYYLKGGADSPENLLGYADFDNTFKNPNAKPQKRKQPLHKYEPHVGDWNAGDPTWRGSKGKGLVGALNYLASKGMNSVYFLTMNVNGDGDDVWPWLDPQTRDRYDCSKLAQWDLVFDHMDRLGIALHVLTQETENDHLLDGGKLGPLRKLYYRELIARFAHHQCVFWNLGEEITNKSADIGDFAAYIKHFDPYDNPIVVHTYPGQKEQVYEPLLGDRNIDGLSLQFGGEDWHTIADVVGGWIRRSEGAGHRWIVNVDEPGSAQRGLDPDAREDNNHSKARKTALWAALFAGGGGVEWYFGYKNPHHDLQCEDWRSRDQFWDQTRHALNFFQQHLPFSSMTPNSTLIQSRDGLCLASPGVYAVYLPQGNVAALDLQNEQGEFSLDWYNPRSGEMLQTDLVSFSAPGMVKLGAPPSEPKQDWAVRIRKKGQVDALSQADEDAIVVEAEDYATQRLNTVRSWYTVGVTNPPATLRDADPAHVAGARGGAYLEILPDTRQSHADPLVNGISFTNEPGKLAVLDYPVMISEPGRYYVWVRAYSTGSEDNGLHMGIDGTWPESGRRLQWCQGKNSWRWESRQRTEKNHCGEPGKIYVDVKNAGLHTISFSMREDGFEFDCFLLTREKGFTPPQD